MRRGKQTYRGKGATKTKVLKEGGGRGKPKTNVLSIGALAPARGSKSTGKRGRPPKSKDDVASRIEKHCSGEGNRLLPNAILFDEERMDRIEFTLNDLSKAGGDNVPNKAMEVEARLLFGTDPGDVDAFHRTLRWLNSVFPDVQPVDFQERVYVVPSERIGSTFLSQFVWRGDSDRYVKIKEKEDSLRSIFLPCIQNIIPRLGIAAESHDFNFDTDPLTDETSIRRRWSYPINSNTAREMGIDYGQDIPPTSDELDLQPEIAVGVIDLTITNREGLVSYSIEIELDSSTITHTKTYEEYEIFAGQPANRPPRNVPVLTLSTSQITLLDSWIKILATVINRSGVLITTSEREAVDGEFNKYLNLSGVHIPSSIVNKPKDLEKRDLAWLNPQDSELFMSHGNYDNSPEENSNRLDKLGIFQPLMGIYGGYYASLKADGTRYYLFFSTTGVYLLNPISRIHTRITGDRTEHPMMRNLIPGTILDVEVIGEIGPDGTLDVYQILAFDALAVYGNDVRHMSYTDRLKGAQDAVEKLKDKNLLDEIVKGNSAVIATSKQDDPTLHWLNSFKIEMKPVYRLPAPSDLDDVDGPQYSEMDKHLRQRALAKDFFKILGSLAEKSILSNTEKFDHNEDKSAIPQKTGDILWYTDGNILTPAERPYLESSDIFRQNPEKSANYSLVRKWKPVMTIDFRVRRNDLGVLTIMSFSEEKRTEVQFTSTYYPWNGNAELDESMEGRIFEFRWGVSENFNGMAFIPVRERTDKPTPNGFTAASAVWGLINDPITVDDLYGNTLTRMRRYHNKVKKSLLMELSDKFHGESPVLWDIGSGRGGDIAKWKKFVRVYATEPDSQNLRDLISRDQRRSEFDYSSFVEDSGLHDHYTKMASLHSRSHAYTPPAIKGRAGKNSLAITKINAKAEDTIALTSAIPVGKVNCVTIFNALTFFYDTIDHVNKLISNITQFLKPGGYCYIIALDGELLLNSMQTREPVIERDDGTESPTYAQIRTKNISISKSEDPSCRKIWIKIGDSIVRGQNEYLINLREFVHLMSLHGLRLVEERYLNEETLLSDEEYWFSSMSKVLKFKFFSNPVKRELGSFLNSIKEKMEANRVIRPMEPHEAPREIISTKLSALGINNLLRYGVLQDGSCYIHAILRAFSKSYKSRPIAEKTGYVIQFRKELAERYTKEIHDAVGDGFFNSSQVAAYSYENLKAAIGQSSFWVNNHLMEYIGDQLQTNVYIIRGVDAEIYTFGQTSGHVKHGRKNVVLYWINDNHYETVGQLEEGNRVRMVYPDDHPLIRAFNQ